MERLTEKKQSVLDFVQVLGQEDVLTGKELVQEQERTSREFEKIRLEKMAFHSHSLQAQKEIFITC